MDNKARLEAWKKSKSTGRASPSSSRDEPGDPDVSDLLETARHPEKDASTEAERKAAKKERLRRERKEELRQEEEERRREIAALLPSEADISARLEENSQRERARQLRRLRNIAIFALAPVVAVLIYLSFIQEQFFRTEASFAITTVNSAPQSPAVNLMGLGGAANAMTDGYRVREYLRSTEVMRIMEREHGYLSHFDGETEAGGRTARLNLDFYRDRVSILVDQQEGLLTLNVDGATPDAAVRYANILIDLAREKVRDISQSIDVDQLEDLQAVEQQAQDKLAQAQARVQETQTRQAELDPRLSAQGIYAIINTLEISLAEAEAQRDALLANGLSESPFLPRLNARISALRDQIAEQQGKLASARGDASLGRSLALFEAALAERDAAVETLASARNVLAQAQLRGLEQRKYLVIIARPFEPLEREQSRLLDLLLIAAAVLIIVLAVGFFFAQRSGRNSE